LVVFAALWQAVALACVGVEESSLSAQALVDTGSAEAAFLVPDSATGAFAHSVVIAGSILLGNFWHTIAFATAVSEAPAKVFLAVLSVADACAFIGIPVVCVIVAGLRLADVCTSFGVPGHNEAGFSVTIGCLEDTDTLCAVPVVISIAAMLILNCA